jgi:hypothetical protein
MARTQTALFNAALDKIHAVGSGQTASAEDVAKASDRLPDLLDELAAEQALYLAITGDPSAEEIPGEIFDPLAILLGLDIRQNVTGEPQPTDQERLDVIKRIRRITTSRTTYEVLRADYF